MKKPRFKESQVYQVLEETEAEFPVVHGRHHYHLPRAT